MTKEIKYIILALLLGVVVMFVVAYFGILLTGFDADIPICYGRAFAIILYFVIPIAIFLGAATASSFLMKKCRLQPLKSIFTVNTFLLLFIIASFLTIFGIDSNADNISFPIIPGISFGINPIEIELFALCSLIIGAFLGTKLGLHVKSYK